MRLRTIFLALVIALLAVLLGIVIYILSQTIIEEGGSSLASFSVVETGAAADFAYGVYNFRGDGNLTVISYPREPRRNVVIINDSQAVQAGRLPELVERLRFLEGYGFSLKVTDETKIGEGIYIIPTGALPSYALFNLQQNSSNGTIVYIGGKDLILSSGMKRLPWYDSLTSEQRARVVVYNGTLDEYLDFANASIGQDVLRAGWMAQNSSTFYVSGDGLRTASIPINGTGYMRIIYEFGSLKGIFDSPRLQSPGASLSPEPQSIYPWERSALQFTLNKTNGTAFLTVKKDGKTLRHDQLRRVTDENVFIERFQYEEPGEYVILVDDNEKVIASGLLHVRDTQIRLLSKTGYSLVFSVMVDGKPLESSEAVVSIGNSTGKKFYISDGTVLVNAKLEKGENRLDFQIGNARIPVTVMNSEGSLFEFYLSYGMPALIIVALVYFSARVTRRPTYRLRFGDSADYIRQEMPLPMERAIEAFSMIRRDMKLGAAPITPHEFSVSLKRYLTNGADVTEGNVEEILRKLVEKGRLETHRDYYQLKGEGDVVRNALRRMICEKLIESGTQFREDGGRFVTPAVEIGFFGERFKGKAIIIVDDKAEEKRILSSLGEHERARLRLLEANGMLSFVPIDRLSDVL